jgi:hypothetical protein
MGLKTTTFCLGYQQITPNTATGLTVPARAPDGSKPQATSVGMPIYVGTSLRYDGDLTNIKFINMVAGGKVNVSYYA